MERYISVPQFSMGQMWFDGSSVFPTTLGVTMTPAIARRPLDPLEIGIQLLLVGTWRDNPIHGSALGVGLGFLEF